MASSRPRPKATAASNRYASAASNMQFDLRNPNTLAASATDEDYDAETAAILHLDEISGQSRGVKRNAVNLDGYDSDSSNDGFGGGKDDDDNDGHKKQKDANSAPADDDDDDDMFGGAGEADNAAGADADKKKAGKSKKDVRFLDIKDIEGQEDDSSAADTSSDSDSDDDSDEESDGGGEKMNADDDEDPDKEEIGPGGKKKNAPKLDKFSVKDEMKEGLFDDQGNFVRRAIDQDAVHDTWLEGLSKKEIKKAKESQERRDQEARQRRLEEDELITANLLSDLILCLERSENALEALARLNNMAKKSAKPKKISWRDKKKNKADGMDMDGAPSAAAKEPEDPKEKARKEQIERITTAADRLLSRGFNDVYDEPREALTRRYGREANEPWVEPVSATSDPGEENNHVDEWEYKWSDGRADAEVHGPYGGTEMKAWKEAGYFQDGVVFRRKGEGEDDWTRLPDF